MPHFAATLGQGRRHPTYPVWFWSEHVLDWAPQAVTAGGEFVIALGGDEGIPLIFHGGTEQP